ncbi:hypothetical protein MNBD_GAMMA26-7 [hydrothermal vent metagenome]|uniref:N-acetyltransferase domain-containing protein n=1 Tax=hydrothermal vent metagenome TaxID=652676 RepID=A0A3B1AZW1_9ZZZZ
MSKPVLKIRPYQATDREKVLAIYVKIWGHEKAKNLDEIWDWKYSTSLFGSRGVDRSLVAEKGGEVIGFLGTMPAMFKIHNHLCGGLWVGDFMTDLQHRGNSGIRLCKALISENEGHVLAGHADSGGSEGAIAHKLWMKLKKTKKDAGYISNLFKRVSIQGAVYDKCGLGAVARLIDYLWYRTRTLSFSTSLQPNFVLEELRCFDMKEGHQINAIVSSYQNIPLRNVEYLNWRYFKRPNTSYIVFAARNHNVLQGYIVLRCKKEMGKLNGRIVDLMVLNGDKNAARFLLATAEHRFRTLGARQVRAYAIKGSFVETELIRFGFSNRSVSDPAFPLLGEYTDQKFFIQHAWSISFADSDFDMD